MLPVAVTMGEPGGIGGEIVLEAWSRLKSGSVRFFSLDDPDRLLKLAPEGVALEVVTRPEDVVEVFPAALPVIPIGLALPAPPGVPSPGNASTVIRSIKRAVALVSGHRASAVVTNPIDKASLQGGADFRYPGHTEFLGELAGITGAPVMMLASGSLRVVPVTVHIPLREVANRLRREDIFRAGRVASEALQRDFGIPAPRLAVAGLNPHAGEGGMFGIEETEIVQPAIDLLLDHGITASGPHPADSLFREGFRDRYDAAICMYHDQALIPLKALGFARAVNITLGLPFIRVSPGHGVAYDLAGTGRASPDALISSIRLASRLAATRSGA